MNLTSFERRWARAIFETMFPAIDDPRLPHGIDTMDIDAHLDDVAARWPFQGTFVLRIGLALIALAPLVMVPRLRTFAGLPADDRVRVLDRLYRNRIYLVRQIVVMVKAVGGFLYGSAPALRGSLSPGLPVPAARLVRKESP